MDRNSRFVLHVGRYLSQLPDDVHAFYDLTKNHVFPVQMRTLFQGDKELAGVGIFAAVGHRQHARMGMTSLEIFVLELAWVNGVATRSILACDISALEHKIRDNSVHPASQEVKLVAFFALAIFTGA